MPDLIAYIPSLHQGYLNFFKKFQDGKLYILGKDLILDLPRMERDIRAIDPNEMKKAIVSLKIFREVEVLGKNNIGNISADIVMPDEDLSHHIAEKYLYDKSVSFESVFLRWDKLAAIKKYNVSPDSEVSKEDFDKEVTQEAFDESKKSSDWWRQVGAIIIKGGKKVLEGHNRHVPTEQNPYEIGDPRSNFDAGERIDLSTVLHAEAGLIARAAQKGISLDGASVYVTTFPCPNCAKIIAYSGIKKVFYTEGYSLLDAESILKNSDVEIIKVKKENTP